MIITEKKERVYNTMIGYNYPFFLDNTSLDYWYLYRVVSPKMLPDYTPLMTLQKVCEKTRSNDFSAIDFRLNHCDVLATILKTRKMFEGRGVKYLEKDIFGRQENESIKNAKVVGNGPYDFPMYEFVSIPGNSTTKSIIVALRDSLRWFTYKFVPGAFVDILLTPRKYGVFEIKGDEKEETLWLEPVAVYNNSDITRSNPLPVDLNRLNYPRDKFTGDKKKRNSDMNRAIRQSDWRSFENREIYV